MAISINEDGNIRDLGVKTEGFTINGIDLLYTGTKSDTASPFTITTPYIVDDYRYLIVILIGASYNGTLRIGGSHFIPLHWLINTTYDRASYYQEYPRQYEISRPVKGSNKLTIKYDTNGYVDYIEVFGIR